MRLMLLPLLLLAAICRSEPPLPATEKLLPAFSWAESKDDDNAVGAAGERGRFQTTRDCWLETNAWRAALGYVAYPFSHASRPEFSRIIAEDYLNYLRFKFEATHGREPTLLELVARWRKPNSGRITKTTYQLYNRVKAKLAELEESR